MKTTVYYSHGKLLLTGEYVVLDGATALALPTTQGQYLSVTPINKPKIIWRSFDEERKIWFENTFLLTDITAGFKNSDDEVSNTLLKILQTAQELNTGFFNSNKGYLVTTRLTFNRQFGLGSSSTLIANIAKWTHVNPYQLLWKAFGGSGYDIACATSNSAITYQLDHNHPIVYRRHFNPIFKKQLYFIYLNHKQSSKDAIQHYKSLNDIDKASTTKRISNITKEIAKCTSIEQFNRLMTAHEEIMSTLLQQKTCKELLFPDYNKGILKSLGAWGGDFILVTTEHPDDLHYFKQKGYHTIFSYDNMIL